MAGLRKSLAQTAQREDLESYARKVSQEHAHQLQDARIDGAARCFTIMSSIIMIIWLIRDAIRFVSKDEKEPSKPESKSLEEKDTPHAGSTRTYRRNTNEAETETPEIKCMCHRPLELDNTRVL
ncbi:hypothetical protein F52700_6871 [Fusarium sp. NRRL 52700]|nr:hypothetical protein F52700_6871 [Fusarium sp. NRRL 52700]